MIHVPPEILCRFLWRCGIEYRRKQYHSLMILLEKNWEHDKNFNVTKYANT